MSPRRSYKKLRAQVVADPRRRARVEEIGQAYDALLKLADLREVSGVTQEEVAEKLHVSQPNVSKIEHKKDFYLSTLCNYVEALGGHLEVNAVFDDQTVGLAVPCGNQRSERNQAPAIES